MKVVTIHHPDGTRVGMTQITDVRWGWAQEDKAMDPVGGTVVASVLETRDRRRFGLGDRDEILIQEVLLQ